MGKRDTAIIHAKVPAEVREMMRELTKYHHLSMPQILERLIIKAYQNVDQEKPLHERAL